MNAAAEHAHKKNRIIARVRKSDHDTTHSDVKAALTTKHFKKERLEERKQTMKTKGEKDKNLNTRQKNN